MKALVLGAGGIGRSTAIHLRDRGVDVTVASRSGRLDLTDVASLSLDAADPDAVLAAATSADVLVNAINPASYTHWARDWPPIAAAILRAAEKSGAGLVTISNLYGYGPHVGRYTEDLPLNATGKGAVRVAMWHEALAAHRAGRVRVTEVRPSDYFGPHAQPGVSYLNSYVIKPAAAGKPVRLIHGEPDTLHSWTYLPDIGALAATLATDDRSWGRAWHVPTAAPRSVRQVVAEVGLLTGRPSTPVSKLPGLVRTAMRVSPIIRSLAETAYQFDADFVVDSSAAQRTFGLQPTEFGAALATTIGVLEPATR